MGKEYKLIAFDMDGTLLNSQKKITQKTLEALKRAGEAGKVVILSTGRGPSELSEYLQILPMVDYLDCTSGALIYDVKAGRNLMERYLNADLIDQLLNIAEEEDVMPQIITSDASIIKREMLECMGEFGMAVYTELYRSQGTLWDEFHQTFRNHPLPAAKLNLYHRNPEARERTKKRILEAELPVKMAYAEQTSLEISAKDVDKGSGLALLCDYLKILLSDTIAVGDADNDLAVLQKAGLAIAMGNAGEHVKTLADVVVADCDHDGCAEAIEKYLL